MHKHYKDGPAIVRQARQQEMEKDVQITRITSLMVWMIYGLIMLSGVFLHAAGWM